MKNKFADLDRQMAKAIRAAEKGVRASQRDLLYQIRKSLDDIYRRYGKDGKLTMDEMRKYKRMRKLEAEIAKTVKKHRQESDKIIKSLLRYSTLKSIEACVDRNTLKPTRVKAIKAKIDVDKIINETVGGRNWLERTKRIEGNVAYDIISEVRAGIDQGISYHEMAAKIDKAMGKYNGRPETIARTETHRVIETSKNDAMVEVNKEIPQMKIWRNAGDEKVRSSHEAMEGQKVPFDEPFELPSGAKAMYPGESGIASEDINCRCIVEYVDATEEEIKEMNADENAEKLDSSGEKGYNKGEQEQEESNKGKKKDLRINRKVIDSSDYDKKFMQIDRDKNMQRILKQNSRDILNHRDGTLYEDLVFIDTISNKVLVSKFYEEDRLSQPTKSMVKLIKAVPRNTIIAIHNHPESSPPSPADLNNCYTKGYKYGLVVCHNGDVWKYKTNKMLDEALYNAIYRKHESTGFSDMNKFIKEVERLGVDLWKI